MCLFSAVLVVCAFFVPFKGKTARAYKTASTMPASIGSITFSDYYEKETVFDASVLKKLYGKILSQNTATYDQLVTAIGNGYKNYANFGDIVLDFGGFKWAVTYVTKSKTGAVSATLILADTILGESQRWNEYTSDSTAAYPANMYSSSKIRVEALNAGGDDGSYAYGTSADGTTKYATSGSALTEVNVNARKNNRWAPFTLSSDLVGKKSLTNYILQPKDLAYQENENYMNIYNVVNGETASDKGGYLTPNESYGVPAPNNANAGANRWYVSGGVNLNYGGDTSTGQVTNIKTGYANWQYDYLWLASATEIGTPSSPIAGRAINGIWGIASNRITGTEIRSATNDYWLRNGAATTSANVYYMDTYLPDLADDGTIISLGANYVNSGSISPKLRPCLHLNLAAAEEGSKVKAPTADTTEFKYTGGTLEYKPKGFDSNVMNITGNKVVNVGTTTVTVTLKDGYVWSDGATEADGTTPKKYEFSFTIDKGTPVVDPQYEDKDHWYPADGLPVLTNKGTAGTFEWKADQSPIVGEHECAYTFTPTDTNSWESYEGTIKLTYDNPSIKSISAAVKAGVDIYDVFTADQLKEYLTVTATYQDNSTHPVLSRDYTVTITSNNGKLVAGGTNTLLIQESGSNKIFNLTLTTVLEAKIDSFVVVLLSDTNFTYPVTESEIIEKLSTVMVNWNYSPDTAEALTDFSSLSIVGTLDAGTQSLKLKSGDVESDAFNVNIAKGTYEIKATLTDGNSDYNGEAKGLTLSWEAEIDGVTAVYLYECAENGYSSSDMPTEAGVYTVTVSFTHDNPNYNAITETKTATLTINKIRYPDADKITFDNKTVSFGGQYSIVAENVPEGVTVTYVYDGNETAEPPVFEALNEEGYEITAKFTHTNPNYNDIADMTAKLIITDKEIYDKSELTVKGDGLTVEDTRVTATYSGEAFTFTPDGKVKDNNGVEVTPTKTEVVYKIDNEVVAEIKNAGTYTVTVTYTMPTDGEYADYEPSFEVKYTVTVNKADFDIKSIVSFNDKTVEYDGEAHSIEIEGELPEWITVSYDGNGKTEAGEYTVTAKFSCDDTNYNDIEDMTAKLTISAGAPVIPPEEGGDDGSSNNMFLYIGIGVGALLLLGLLLFLLLRRKRADGYDDDYDDEYDYDDDEDEDDEDDEDYEDYDE